MIPEDFPGLLCGCGASIFRRVVVERQGRPPVATVLAECMECHAAYVSCPPADNPSAFERDVKEAAKDYRKPGRGLKPGERRRR